MKRLFIALAAVAAISLSAKAQDPAEVATIEMEEECDTASVLAPEFTLKNLEGRDVSLTDFKGKWVVIDFWGSWCRYCLEGFPAMKEAYAKYHPLGLEIIGIDCGETEEQWRAAVERLGLPWINVFNPENRREGLCKRYEVKGFPTKVLVNPEGYIYESFMGEVPEFYTTLEYIFSEE